MSCETIFIIGTDTGVGKTLLTALLLWHLRKTGCHALAIKPFCTGDRADAEILHALQEGDLSLEQINPFYFSQAVAPLVAARKHQRHIPLGTVLEYIQDTKGRFSPSAIASRPSVLLIEGAGGLLT